jgi:4-hydroxy 2-oxovalerate aldolase
MRLMDVTLRDGGHQVGFEWSDSFVLELYQILSEPQCLVEYIELGYWGQTGKYSGPYYQLSKEKLNRDLVTHFKSDLKISVMADFHYRMRDLDAYPGLADGVHLIRLTARREEIVEASEFAVELMRRTGVDISLNLFNISNYTHEELVSTLRVIPEGFSFIYLADTHGALNLTSDGERFAEYSQAIQAKGAAPGFHLHDHGGFALSNFLALEDLGFEIADASVAGLGKGLGNLRLEHVIDREGLTRVLDFVYRNKAELTMPDAPLGLIGARMSVADHYSLQADELLVPAGQFVEFVESLSVSQRDNYSPQLLGDWLGL